MAGAKLIVIYPSPRDVGTFERAYTQEHGPMVTPQNFKGLHEIRRVQNRGNSRREPGALLQGRGASLPVDGGLASSRGFSVGTKSRRPAISISTGGKPIVLVAEEDAKIF